MEEKPEELLLTYLRSIGRNSPSTSQNGRIRFQIRLVARKSRQLYLCTSLLELLRLERLDEPTSITRHLDTILKLKPPESVTLFLDSSSTLKCSISVGFLCI